MLSEVIPRQSLGEMQRWVIEAGAYRERIYGPFTTGALYRASARGRSQLPGTVARGVERAGGARAVALSGNGPLIVKAPLAAFASSLRTSGARVGRRMYTPGNPPPGAGAREVKLIDGTTVSMPDTEANQARFPQHREQKPGLGFPVARVGRHRVRSRAGRCSRGRGPRRRPKDRGRRHCCGTLKAPPHGGRCRDRRSLPRGLLLIAALVATGVDIVMRQHRRRRTDFRRGRRLGFARSPGRLGAPAASGLDG